MDALLREPLRFFEQTAELFLGVLDVGFSTEKACALGPAHALWLEKIGEIKRCFGGKAYEEFAQASLRYLGKYLECWARIFPGHYS